MTIDGNGPSTSGRGAVSDLDKTNPATGDGMILYPSGNIAVIVSKEVTGNIITFFSDSASSQILASFNTQGVGSVQHYPCGSPWLVVTENGYTLSDKKGNIQERGKFPRNNHEPITLAVSESLTIKFSSRQNIVASFSAGDVAREWQCGESPRRSEGPYTAKAVGGREGGGRLELDVAAIRQRQQTVGDVYVSPGPHHTETERPGLGSLRKALRRLDPACSLSSTVSELRNLDTRLGVIGNLPRVLYGTARAPSASALLGSSGAGGAGGGGTGAALGGSASGSGFGLGSGTGRVLPDDYGSPELSQAQRKLASSMRAAEQRPRYKARRVKLPWMRLKDVDSAVCGSGAPSDTLIMLCVLADWNPICARVEAALEATHGSFLEEEAARSSSDAARIKMYKLDASEGNTLQDRYGFRTVPMLLCFHEGRLVAATNAVRSPQEGRAAALGGLLRGRKREYLPEGFRFAAGADNTLLEYIRPSTVLREL